MTVDITMKLTGKPAMKRGEEVFYSSEGYHVTIPNTVREIEDFASARIYNLECFRISSTGQLEEIG